MRRGRNRLRRVRSADRSDLQVTCDVVATRPVQGKVTLGSRRGARFSARYRHRHVRGANGSVAVFLGTDRAEGRQPKSATTSSCAPTRCPGTNQSRSAGKSAASFSCGEFDIPISSPRVLLGLSNSKTALVPRFRSPLPAQAAERRRAVLRQSHRQFGPVRLCAVFARKRLAHRLTTVMA